VTGLPFFEGFAPASIRTTLACFESVERELADRPLIDLPGVGTVPEMNEPALAECAASPVKERPLKLVELLGDVVTVVEEHPCGTLMRFRSGAAIVLGSATYDAAGLLVIEP
jgi:hypothetical protein